jgi:hypothetical protein
MLAFRVTRFGCKCLKSKEFPAFWCVFRGLAGPLGAAVGQRPRCLLQASCSQLRGRRRRPLSLQGLCIVLRRCAVG